jgi:hypothetical protein
MERKSRGDLRVLKGFKMFVEKEEVAFVLKRFADSRR